MQVIPKLQLGTQPKKAMQKKRTTHSYLPTPGLEEIMKPSSRRKKATRSKEEMRENGFIQVTRTQTIIMIMKKVKRKVLQVSVDTQYQETALASKI